MRRILRMVIVIAVAVAATLTPSVAVGAGAAMAADSGCQHLDTGTHCYVRAVQHWDQPYAHGVGAFFDEPADLPGVTSDGFSITQLAILAPGMAVEFGWIASVLAYGDTRPRLFAFLRVPGNKSCGITGGLNPFAEAFEPCPPEAYVWLSKNWRQGAPVAGTGNPQFYHIGYFAASNSWWIQYGNEQLGYINGSYFKSIASAGFTQATEVQWYGEVAYDKNPCIPMGNGYYGRDPGSARISGMFYEATGQDGLVTAKAAVSTSDSRFWNTDVGNAGQVDEFRYGGPGSCAR
jgi:hypothetical protein